MPPPSSREAGSSTERIAALFATPIGRALKTTLVGALAFLVLSVVVRQARAAVHRIPTYRIEADDVAFVDLPSFVDERIRAGLRLALCDLFPDDPKRLPSLYDADAERRLREMLSAHPMIREISDIDVRYPSEVRVHATVRAPLARFRARVGRDRAGQALWIEVPVDPEGVVLDPDTYGPMLAARHFVRVTGVDASCPGIGRRWSDVLPEQVAEGLSAARVANRLNEEMTIPRAPRVDEVDVSAFPASPKNRGRGEVVFKLSDGRRVQWGRTERDLSGVSHEDGYDVKRERLIDLLEARDASDRRELDVRFPPTRRSQPD